MVGIGPHIPQTETLRMAARLAGPLTGAEQGALIKAAGGQPSLVQNAQMVAGTTTLSPEDQRQLSAAATADGQAPEPGAGDVSFRTPAAQGETTPIASVGRIGPAAPLHSEAELRKLLSEQVYPAVRDAIQAFGGTTDGTYCHLGAAFAKIALEKLGIPGAEIYEANQHVMLKVKTAEGKTLIFDPTAAQFFKNGTQIDNQLQKQGFVGTEDELRAMIHNHIGDWDFHGNLTELPPEVVSVLGGASRPDLSAEEARLVAGPHLDKAESTYFRQLPTGLATTARKYAQYFSQPDGNRKMVEFLTGRDVTAQLQAAFDVLRRIGQ